jgi:transcriptional regulator with XRE-family HTH domain
MIKASKKFGPQTDEEAVVFAVENFIGEVQVAIFRLLSQKELTQAELSRLMGVSQARVSKILGDDAQNITLETVARVFHALGEAPEIRCQKLGEGSRAELDHSQVWVKSHFNAARRRAANQNWPSPAEYDDAAANKAAVGKSAAYLRAEEVKAFA